MEMSPSSLVILMEIRGYLFLEIRMREKVGMFFQHPKLGRNCSEALLLPLGQVFRFVFRAASARSG